MYYCFSNYFVWSLNSYLSSLSLLFNNSLLLMFSSLFYLNVQKAFWKNLTNSFPKHLNILQKIKENVVLRGSPAPQIKCPQICGAKKQIIARNCKKFCKYFLENFLHKTCRKKTRKNVIKDEKKKIEQKNAPKCLKNRLSNVSFCKNIQVIKEN